MALRARLARPFAGKRANRGTGWLCQAADRSRRVRDKLLAEQQDALAAWTQMHQAERAAQVR